MIRAIGHEASEWNNNTVENSVIKGTRVQRGAKIMEYDVPSLREDEAFLGRRLLVWWIA